MPVSILRRYGTVCCRGQLLCGGAVFAWYCRRDASHISQENDKLNGALDGAAGRAGMKTQNYKPRYLLVNLMASRTGTTAWETVYAKYWCARNKAPEGVLPVNHTQQGEAQICVAK